MKIEIDPHTIERAAERGVTEEEIIDVLKNGEKFIGKFGRLGKSKVFNFNNKRNGKYYKHKKVEVYYIEESVIIVTVTVYAFYGIWT